MSSTFLSTESYYSAERHFNRSPMPNRRAKGYGFIADSGSDNTDVDSDGRDSDDEFRQRATSLEDRVSKEEKVKERKVSVFTARHSLHEEKGTARHSLHEEKGTARHSNHEEKGKENKHGSTFSLNSKSSEDKSRKLSHGHFSGAFRKLSNTFTRKNSTSTSPEMVRKGPLQSKSSSLVSNSPEMIQRKIPLKSNSSSLVGHGDSSSELRRYAFLMNSQNSDEPRRRCTLDKHPMMNPLVMSRKRSGRGPFECASNPDIASSTTYKNGTMKDFNIYCLGTKETGKTALAVRFLTGRYIHEYVSIPVETYTRVMKYGGERVNVHIFINDTGKMEEDIELGINPGIMVIYSITDRNSFKEASSLLRHLKVLSITNTVPVILVATKADLERRKIDERSGSTLANKYNCSHFDVSAAADENVRECFHAAFRQIEARHYLRDENEPVERNILKARTDSFKESHLEYSLRKISID